MTVLWIDPSGAIAFRRDTVIGGKRPGGVYTLGTKTQFKPGIWRVLLQSKDEQLAELEYLVLPKMNDAETPLNETKLHDDQDQYVNKTQNAKLVNFDVKNVKLIDKTQTSELPFKGDLLSWIDELTAQFWRPQGMCALQDLGQYCEDVPLCIETSWSSLSQDPKSEIRLDGSGNIIK